MSVLIKGMNMPKNCTLCFMRDNFHDYCPYEQTKERDCPLIEVPTPHGPLMDARAFYENTVEWEAEAFDQLEKFDPQDEKQRGGWKCWNIVLAERTAFKHDVMDAPIIIEAEKGEDE